MSVREYAEDMARDRTRNDTIIKILQSHPELVDATLIPTGGHETELLEAADTDNAQDILVKNPECSFSMTLQEKSFGRVDWGTITRRSSRITGAQTTKQKVTHAIKNGQPYPTYTLTGYGNGEPWVPEAIYFAATKSLYRIPQWETRALAEGNLFEYLPIASIKSHGIPVWVWRENNWKKETV